MVLRVGLTGGLASGKSTVAARLATRGLEVLDVDRVVHAFYAPGEVGAAAVSRAFGPGFLNPDGSVDRPALAAAVFSDPGAVRRLNQAIHPLVAAEVARFFVGLEERAAATGIRGIVGVVEATLLVEAGAGARYDVVVTVSASPAVRLARALARDRGRSEAELVARMAAQISDADRERDADIVLVADGDLPTLLARVDALAEGLLARAEER